MSSTKPARWTLPLGETLRGYRAAWLSKDISAGLAIAAVGLPSAIAYPAIACLPAETGLYASILAALGLHSECLALLDASASAYEHGLRNGLTALLVFTSEPMQWRRSEDPAEWPGVSLN